MATHIEQAVKWSAYAVVAAIGFLVLVKCADTPEAREKADARFAIEQCWKDQGRKSLDPSAARLIAEVCEKHEADFRTKFGHAP